MRKPFIIVAVWGMIAPGLWAADSPDNTAETKAYWQGNNLNNQSRLAQPFEGFEVQGQKRALDRTSDAYLETIRQQIAGTAAAGKSEQVLNFHAGSLERAVTLVHSENGVIILTLNLASLFDENTASLRNGALDVLDRVAQVLSQAPAKPTQLVLKDELAAVPEAPSLDAERAQCVMAYLNFQRFPDDILTPS